MYTRGWHPLSIMVEDYAWKPGQGLIRLSKIPVQFTIRIHSKLYDRYSFKISNPKDILMTTDILGESAKC